MGPVRGAARAAETVQFVLGIGSGGGGEGRGAGPTGVPHRMVPVRGSYTRPGGPCRTSSFSTFWVRGTDQERAAARPGTEVVPRDLRVAIACCRSSGAGRDQKGSRTERGGPGPSRKSIVRRESRGQKWVPAERLSVSWTVPPRDAFRRYPRPSYVHRERLYSYRALREVTTVRIPGPRRVRSEVERNRTLRVYRSHRNGRNLQARLPASIRMRWADSPGGPTIELRSRRGRAPARTLREGRGVEDRQERDHAREAVSRWQTSYW